MRGAMTEPESCLDRSAEDTRVAEIVRRGPAGAFAVAGIATAIVVLIYFGFYPSAP